MTRVLLLAIFGLTAFGLSFYTTERLSGTGGAEAHGTHCATYEPRKCDRYYAGQWRCCATGVQGRIKATDVTLVSPTTDFTSHWVGITSLDQIPEEVEWAQMGFREGPNGYGQNPVYSPNLYTEYRTTKCYSLSGFQYLGTPGGLWDFMYVTFTGNYYTCANNPNIVQYEFELRNSSPSGTVWLNAYLASPFGYYEAQSELLNNHAINPNGTQCFGTNSSCYASPSYGLKACCSNGQWIHWPASTSSNAHDPYNRVVTGASYSFYTYGGP